MTTLYAHNDRSHWGEQFVMACGRANVPFKLFKKAKEVPAGAHAFVRLSQQAEQRGQSKNMVQALHEKGVNTFPSPLDALLYDDKVAQYEYLKDYLPKTTIIRDQDAALDLANDLEYPIISKGSEGAGSSCVRLLRNRKAARREAVAAFGDGLPSSYDKKQKGFLYWQEFIKDNTCDYRIIICGKYIFGIVRQVRNNENKPFASGSGVNAPIMSFEGNTKEAAAARKAIEIAAEIGSEWVAFDFVFKKKEIYCLEMSCSWTTFVYAPCPVFEFTPNGGKFLETGKYGGGMFDMAVEIMRKQANA